MPRIKQGFTLLELIVVILIVGMISSLIIPTLRYQTPAQQTKDMVVQIGHLINTAWQSALIKQKTHRIVYDLKKNTLTIEIEKETKGSSKETFEAISFPYRNSTYALPSSAKIKQLFVDNADILNRPGVKTETAWFYISSDGLVQPTIINIAHRAEYDTTNNETHIGLVLNPFSGQIKEYETFAKP